MGKDPHKYSSFKSNFIIDKFNNWLKSENDNLSPPISLNNSSIDYQKLFNNFYFLFNSNKSAIIILDPSGNIIDLNTSALNLFSLKKENSIRKHFSEMLTTLKDKKFIECFNEFISNKDELSFETSLKLNDNPIKLEVFFFQFNEDENSNSCVIINELKSEKTVQTSIDYENYIELLNDAIIIFEPNSEIILEANTNAAKLYGFSQEELIGTSLKELTKSKKKGEKKIRKLLSQRHPLKFETVHFTKTGREIYLEVKASVIDYYGEDAILVVLHNLTKIKKFEEELIEDIEKLEMAQRIAKFGSWDWDLESDVITLSGELVNIFELENSEITTDFLLSIINEEDKKGVKNCLIKIKNGEEEINFDFGFKSKNHGTVYLSATGKVICDEDDNPRRVFGIFHDITKRKVLEKSLKVSINDLEKSNQDLEMFAYVVSHDLKDPLYLTANFLKLFTHKYEGKIDQKADDYIRHINDAINRMHLLIHSLLSYSRITTRGKPFVEIDGNQVLEVALKNLAYTIEKTETEIQADNLPVFKCDYVQIAQLFQNLISNSIKFSIDKPKIKINYTENETDHIFSVSDNGIGIEPKHFKRIFEIFQRLHTNDDFEGTGMGLAICKRIVDRHNGKIWVESIPAKGSTFYFSLPKTN